MAAIVGVGPAPAQGDHDKPAAQVTATAEADPATPQAPADAHLRFIEDVDSSRLESAWIRLENDAGTVVDLAGAVHIADAAYYEEFNRRFREYDTVLYEMVGGEGDIKAKLEAEPDKGNFIRFTQVLLKNALQLEFQLDGIDYGAENFVHADMSAEEFVEAQAAAGDSIESIMGRLLKAQIDQAAGNPDEPPGAAAGLDFGALFGLFGGGADNRALKLDLARGLGNAETLIRAIEGEQGSVLLTGRNRTAVSKLQEILAHGHDKVAIFYGAAHLAGIERILLDELGFRRTSVEWMPAWTIPPAEPASEPAPGEPGAHENAPAEDNPEQVRDAA